MGLNKKTTLMKTLTVFTPTYNRAHLLRRLYESLVTQSCQDFEWLVIDDGSTDFTRQLVESFIETVYRKETVFIIYLVGSVVGDAGPEFFVVYGRLRRVGSAQ